MNKINNLQNIDANSWLQELQTLRPELDIALLQQAISLAQITGEDQISLTGQSCFAQGLEICTVLNNLNLDSVTLAAGILYSSIQYTDLNLEDVAEHLGEKVAKLLRGTKQMENISEMYRVVSGRAQYKHNVDNIRKMLLAMVDDIRVVIIKLAERLTMLRHAANFSLEIRQQIAAEIMAIYAPLTNRLGIAQLKWELEDLAFWYLEPEKYQEVLTALNKNFPERQEYIKNFVSSMQQFLQTKGLQNFKVTGRAKHVYSVYRKMQRKQKGFESLFDICAIRVFVPTVVDCYSVLSYVHEKWQLLPQEFDDYIVSPKENGYRSIHTAVLGLDNRIVEIQIRTFEMHQQAELGIAAHWVYKEGKQEALYEAKIAWLRQLLDWQAEVTKAEATAAEIREMFNDQVYIFTPEGDVIDLQKGATPLDFAYHIHSDLGHRCNGAKVNKSIVPLTYQLKTGDRIEILTTKNANPSRDWLNPNYGYLKTSRARSKVFHWFKKQNQDKNITLGQEILNKEMQRLGIKSYDLNVAVASLNYKNTDELLVGLGSGCLKISTLLHTLKLEINKPESEVKMPAIQAKVLRRAQVATEIQVADVDNLLTRIAGCCKPIPGEKIVGYITQTQGISVHRHNCPNILFAQKNRPERLLAISWGEKTTKCYPVDLLINAFDRAGLVRDITNVLAEDNINVAGLEIATDRKEQTVRINMTIEIEGVTSLSKVLTKIEQVPNVLGVRHRLFS